MRLVSLLVVAAALAAAGCGSSGPRVTTTVAKRLPTTTSPTPHGSTPPTTIVIEVGSHGVAGGPVRQQLQKGQKVILLVRSAVADEIHVHGYDLRSAVPAHGQTQIPFTATILGRFAVELERRHLQIAELDVH